MAYDRLKSIKKDVINNEKLALVVYLRDNYPDLLPNKKFGGPKGISLTKYLIIIFSAVFAGFRQETSSSGYLNNHIYHLTQNIDSGRPASTESSSADDWPDDASIEIGENSALPMPFV